MSLWPGLDYNLTAYQHLQIIKQLFSAEPETRLPATVTPLSNNTTLDSIIAMMPSNDANSVLPNWEPRLRKLWLPG